MTAPFTFVLTLSQPYDPALLELSIIRPLRFLSPASFFTDAPGDNSCPASRGNVTARGTWALCRGIKSPMGTGPYKYVVRGAVRQRSGARPLPTSPPPPHLPSPHPRCSPRCALQSKTTSLGRVMTPANVSFTALQPGELVLGVEWAVHAAWWGDASLLQPPTQFDFPLHTLQLGAGLSSGSSSRTLGLSQGAIATANWIRIAPPAQTGLVSCDQGYRVLLPQVALLS